MVWVAVKWFKNY